LRELKEAFSEERNRTSRREYMKFSGKSLPGENHPASQTILAILLDE
jgi:hypothetical protein